MKNCTLEIAAFVAGAAMMAIEIVASRIMAPFLGNSIVVWTSLIGAILAALSCGYWRGGQLADKDCSVQTLSKILVFAAGLTALTAVVRNLCLGVIVALVPDIGLAALVAAVTLFAPVAFLLAMVSPYTVRLKIREVGSSGETVGRLYAISTIGSIVGTFGAGFYLLSVIGSTAILLCTSALLLLASIILSVAGTAVPRLVAATFIAACAYAAPRTAFPFITQKHVLELDTKYNHCLVVESVDPETKRPVRSLLTDIYTIQSAVFADRDDDLVLPYAKWFRLGLHFNPSARQALLLGGGGFTYVKDFFRRNPEASLDIVEIDPELQGIAQRYFGLTPHPGLRVFSEDARTYLNRVKRTYDVVYVDVMGSAATLPYYLTTKETGSRLFNSIDRNGIVLMNILSRDDNGSGGEFLNAEIATYRSVFPRVEVFRVGDRRGSLQNFILVAFKNSVEPQLTSGDPEINRYLAGRLTDPAAAVARILTDDFVPVEAYLARALRRKWGSTSHRTLLRALVRW